MHQPSQIGSILGLALLGMAGGTVHAQAGGDPTGDPPPPVFPDQPDASTPADETDAGEGSVIDHTMDGTQYAADITLMEGVRPLFPPPEQFTELDLFHPIPQPLNAPTEAPLLGSPLEMVMAPVRNTEEWTQDNLGLSWNIYYTLLWQGATRTVVDPTTNSPYGRNAGTGRLDLGFNWNIFDEPGIGHGQVGVLVRNGVVIGQPSTYRMSQAVGSEPVGVDSLYWGNNTSLCLLYWQQGFLDDRAVFTIGKIHPNQYIMLSRVANDESRQFLASPYDGLNTLGPSLGTYTPGVALQLAPIDGLYINAVAIDASGGPNLGFSTVGDGNWWAAGQVGWVPEFNLGEGRVLTGNWAICLAGTNYGMTPDGSGGLVSGSANGIGFGAMIEQQVSPGLEVMVQYGLSNSSLSPAQQAATVVLGWLNPFGRNDDMFGVGVNWTKPSSDFITPHREEISMEMFYRLQLTSSVELSPDVQVLFQPSTGDDDPIVIFGLRLRTQF